MSLRRVFPDSMSLRRYAASARSRSGAAVALFLAINIVLGGLHLWSRGGQTTHVRFVVRGGDYAAYIDGKRTAESAFAAPSGGALVLTVADTRAVPLPKPSGIDSVRVVDLATGGALFQDDFSSGPDPQWTVSGIPLTGDGVIGAIGEAKLTLPDRGWRDYTVEVTYKNIKRATITVRSQSGGGVLYDFRTFRQYDNRLTLLEQGVASDSQEGAPVQLSRVETVKSLLAMSLEPYPRTFEYLLAGLAAVLLLQVVLRAVPVRVALRMPARVTAALPYGYWLAAAVIALVGFAITLRLNYSYGSHMPHLPDELAYIFQAKLLASGHLTTSPPSVRAAFEYFYPPFIIESHEKWSGVYPFGHPMLLAIGARIGAIWLVPPITGGATIVLLFALGRKLYGARVGLLAALVLLTSPFFLMTSSNFMSHNTAALYLLASLFFIAIAERRPVLHGGLAGLFFGLLFNTQALSSVALMPALGALMLTGLRAREHRRAGMSVIAAFAAGALVMLGAYFMYNWRTTGDPLQSALQIGADSGKTLGFSGDNTPNIGMQNLQGQMAFFRLVLTGWPLYVGLMFVLLPIVLATKDRWDWFLLAAAISMLGIYVLFVGNGIAYGPRYWYVASPLAILLIARGADIAADVLSRGAVAILRAWSGGEAPPRPWTGMLITYAVVLALVWGSAYGWLLGKHPNWSDPLVPKNPNAMRNFNSVDDRLVALVDDAHLHHALVLVDGCPGWQCYSSVFWLNAPTFDGSVVFALNLPQHRDELLAAYAGWDVYVANYNDRSLAPYAQAPP